MKSRIMKGIIAFTLCTSMVLSNISYVGASLSENAATDADENIDENTDENVEENTEENTDENTGESEVTPDDGTTVSDNEIPLSPTVPTEEVVEEEKVVLETEVNGIKITLTGSAQAIPEGSQLQATELEPQTVETEIVEKALENEEAVSNIVIHRYRAFDIKIMNGQEEVQPGEKVEVAFSGDLLVPEDGEKLDVFHIDEVKETAESVSNNAIDDSNLVMETNHFSTYVITISSDSSVETKVTTRYYLNETNPNQQLYRPKESVLEKGTNGIITIPCKNTIKDNFGNVVYRLNKYNIKITKNGTQLDPISGVNDASQSESIISISHDELKNAATVEVELFYDAEKSTYDADTKFYDYDVASYRCNLQAENHSATKFESFTVNGISGENYQLKKNKKKFVLKKSNENDIPLTDGTTLRDVQINSKDLGVCTFRIDEDSAYLLTNQKTKISSSVQSGKNSGINSTAVLNSNNFLGMGKSGNNYYCNELQISKVGQGTLDANNYIGGKSANDDAYKYAIIPDLVMGLSDQNNKYSDLVMGKNKEGNTIVEPKYFSDEPVVGKTNYTDGRFQINFNQYGNRYKMTGVTDTETNKYYKAADIGENGRLNKIPDNFFPLEGVKTNLSNYGDESKAQNEYFGMRYDFNFTLGDYIGPLTYEFQGDDDLWVFVDGQRVLDLGGIHMAFPDQYKKASEKNSVDLWEKLFGYSETERANNPDWWKGINEEEWTQSHQVTVLYMERGGVKSSCYMDFTLPNVTGMDAVVITTPEDETTFDSHINKTAEVNDWDQRIYNVNLYADAEITHTSTVIRTKPVDVVLVLDVSGSMTEKDVSDENGNKIERREALKRAVNNFIDHTAVTSPESRISIVTFNTEVSEKIDYTMVDSSGVNALKEIVKNLDADGGTRQDKALITAGMIAKRADSNRDVNVILFSDGVPDDSEIQYPYQNGYNRQYLLNMQVEDSANSIKSRDKTKLFSIFLGANNGKMPKRNDIWNYSNDRYYGSSSVTYKDWFMNTLPTSGCGFTANSADSLKTIFQTISEQIVQSEEVKGTIVDVIDSRFDLLDSEGYPITAEDVSETSGKEYGDAKLYMEDGTGQIKIVWENITIPSADAGGWSKQIQLKAKNQYAGGNDVPTNGDNSYVYLDENGNGTAEENERHVFQKPTVNVKVQFEVSNVRDVYFLGEKVNDLYPNGEGLKERFKADILQHTERVDEKDIIFTYTDTRDIKPAQFTVKEGLLAKEPTISEDITDAVSVTVEPVSNGIASANNMLYTGTRMDGFDDNGNKLTKSADGNWYYAVCNPVTATGSYRIYVVDGKLDITKEIDRYYEEPRVTDKISDNQVFIFKIERFEDSNGNGIIEEENEKDSDFGEIYETISFSDKDDKDANGKDILSKTESLIGLERGYYKVTEETEWSWKYQNEKTLINGDAGKDYIYIGERIPKENGKVSFVGLDIERRSYAKAGRYEKLLKDTQFNDVVDMVDILNADERKAVCYFENIYDKKKKRILGDVSVMTNIFK